MYKSMIRSFGKCMLYAVILSAVLILTALVITKTAMCPLNDVLFMEGILFVMLGIFSSIGGNPIGLSFQVTEQNNAQYLAKFDNESFELEKKNEELPKIETTINISTTMISLVIAGVVCILINYII
ncbi:hypothetical protein [Clostridium sp. 1001271B_151109_B4]|uniref:hypothetical protein n=1 Tax=Clostridium sp. 1001271B_151109_B4 TaxID=2787148 RepID=UPI0018A8BCDD|nr:hypothetical protein [Clostridium sp. 1001271B_151109_B4]